MKEYNELSSRFSRPSPLKNKTSLNFENEEWKKSYDIVNAVIWLKKQLFGMGYSKVSNAECYNVIDKAFEDLVDENKIGTKLFEEQRQCLRCGNLYKAKYRYNIEYGGIIVNSLCCSKKCDEELKKSYEEK